jgi:hypothetical protein
VAQYVEIDPAEMHDFLTGQGFVRVGVEGTHEAVYAKLRSLSWKGKVVPLSVRVYTTMVGTQRDKGEDAIRVSLWFKVDDPKTGRTIPVMIGGLKRVHRVQNWKRNLQARIDDAFKYRLVPCPECGSPMVERKNRGNGDRFLGCCRYPVCKKTVPIRDTPVG